MAYTPTPVFVQAPKVWSASINAGDASNWKILRDAASAAGAGPNGSKISSVIGTSTDTSSRDVILAIARQYSCTVTSANPGVVTIASGANVANGDQVVFEGSAVPTGLTAGTTYFVVGAVPSTQAGVACTFNVSATFGGSTITTSSTGTTVVVYVIRPLTAMSNVTLGGIASTAPTNYFFNPANWPGLPVDNDGTPYVFLESSDFLAVSSVTTVTAAKIMTFTATGGNF